MMTGRLALACWDCDQTATSKPPNRRDACPASDLAAQNMQIATINRKDRISQDHEEFLSTPLTSLDECAALKVDMFGTDSHRVVERQRFLLGLRKGESRLELRRAAIKLRASVSMKP